MHPRNAPGRHRGATVSTATSFASQSGNRSRPTSRVVLTNTITKDPVEETPEPDDSGTDDSGTDDGNKELPRTGADSVPTIIGTALALMLIGGVALFYATHRCREAERR